MVILKTSLKDPDIYIINRAVEVLNNGGLIIYPTDTAYGLGGNALDENVIKKVYQVKGRDYNKPTHVIIRDWKTLEELTHTNVESKILYDNFLPGPLTIILKKKKIVPDILTSGLNTLGIRIPECKVTELISEQTEYPFTTPSANKTGGNTPYSIKEVANELDINKIDLIIDCGTLTKNKPSTVVDLINEPFKILREGPISVSQLQKALKVSNL